MGGLRLITSLPYKITKNTNRKKNFNPNSLTEIHNIAAFVFAYFFFWIWLNEWIHRSKITWKVTKSSVWTINLISKCFAENSIAATSLRTTTKNIEFIQSLFRYGLTSRTEGETPFRQCKWKDYRKWKGIKIEIKCHKCMLKKVFDQ